MMGKDVPESSCQTGSLLWRSQRAQASQLLCTSIDGESEALKGPWTFLFVI
jgi:hypothetical protein